MCYIVSEIYRNEVMILIFSLITFLVTCVLLISAVLFLPRLRIGKIGFDTYWVVALSGALLLIFTGNCPIKEILSEMTGDSAINPLKILTLFLSMTALSVFLDEVGFFRYLAAKMLSHAGSGQMKLFFMLYGTVSLLTVFTSNDIVVLTFTPFICYFASSAGIDPIPYLVTEFVAANSWSMLLIIGNPTNIYLATAGGIGFLEYFLKMILPTVAAGLVSLLILWLLFRKKLAKPLTALPVNNLRIADKGLLILGILHLGGCTVCVATASFLGLPMWILCLGFALSLFITTGIYCLIRRRKPLEIFHTFFRIPWQLAPFMLSMFVLILTLQRYGITKNISSLLASDYPIFTYGIAAYLTCNIINNIPMSVFFSSVLAPLGGSAGIGATYAVIAASNWGALFTPVGALAGIMWMSILREKNIRFTFMDFTRYGAAVSLPSLLTALFTLHLVI